MNAQPNIFEKLALDNDFGDFDSVSIDKVEKNKSPTEFVDVVDTSIESGNIFENLANKENSKQENQFGFLDTAKDIGQQILSKGTSGLLGAYGNIADTFGLQPKETLPSEQAKYSKEFDTLSKLEKGEKPSFSELIDLSEGEDVPRYSRLPTSQEVQKDIKSATGIGEGKTPAGRIAGRGAEFLGEGLAIPGGGPKALATLGAAGLAGQGVREAGGPELLATGTEIVGSIIPSAIQGKVVPTGKEAKKLADAGRALGLTEKQITPLIQGEKKVATLSKVARKGSKTKDLFGSIKESLGDAYQGVKNSVSNYGNVNATNRQILLDKFTNIRNDLTKTVKASPDKEAAINFINDAIDKVSKVGASPEELINFWQDINKSVRWNSIQGGKKSLARLKEPISEVLNNVAPAAAKDFEMANQLYSKYSQIAKKLKPDWIESLVNKGELVSVIPSGMALVHGNPMPLMAIGGEVATRLLSREMLINPYFQNIATKLVTNFNQGSVKGVTELVKQVQDYMKRKHPNEDWNFLTEE